MVPTYLPSGFRIGIQENFAVLHFLNGLTQGFILEKCRQHHFFGVRKKVYSILIPRFVDGFTEAEFRSLQLPPVFP